MTQPAKSQEPSMEEILASIRRIIADDAPKTPHNDGLRSESAQTGSTRMLGRDSLRRALRDISRLQPRVDTPAVGFQEPDAGDDEEHSLPAVQRPRSEPSRMLPEAHPAAVSSRASQESFASPSSETGMQQEEIEAFLAEFGTNTSHASDAPADATESIPASKALPAPEFDTPDDVIEPTGELDMEEQSQAEPEEKHQPRAAAQPRPQPPRTQAREQPPFAQRPYEREPAGDALISADTSAAVNSAFNTLAQSVLVQNGRTLEDVVREMLRPMLKMWLDDNLPAMVERLVRAEIERVARGRG